jgi:hypothetical protein
MAHYFNSDALLGLGTTLGNNSTKRDKGTLRLIIINNR